MTAAVHYAEHRTGVEGFVAAWTALGGTAEQVATSEVGDAVTRFAAGRSPVMAVAGLDLHTDLSWPVCGLEAAATAKVGVVRGAAAVAQTGSVVVRSDDNFGRSASLLPDAAVFVVAASSIVDTPGDVLRTMEAPPSQLVFVTGPSRSADIELRLVVGVHGPGEVHAIITT